jgi:hypothetical protein
VLVEPHSSYKDPRIKSNELLVTHSGGVAAWQYPLIKKAIEQILNDESKGEWDWSCGIPKPHGWPEKKYTESDLDKAREEGFNIARWVRIGSYPYQPLYETYEDYKKAKQKR